MCAVQISPEWYTAACRNLEKIEAHADDYSCPEEGYTAPSRDIFPVVQKFFNKLRRTNEKLEEPRIFVSPEGHILLNYGSETRNLDIRFAPSITFFFSHNEVAPVAGYCEIDAINLLAKYFRI
ncbi:MAG: hypothetical protein C0473_03785 [Cyanobacteria bacterium DS3.002]|nr:hypothetical protein [Cyanobacteria bacterium DS3.002]MBA4049938.1 hypothetical protein [Cyanobacteria bacterium DS2.008]